MGSFLRRAYYQANAGTLLDTSNKAILGEIVAAHVFAADILQVNSWQHQIARIRDLAEVFPSAFLFFEFAIPRMGKRADVVLLIQGLVFVLEYKVGCACYC